MEIRQESMSKSKDENEVEDEIGAAMWGYARPWKTSTKKKHGSHDTY